MSNSRLRSLDFTRLFDRFAILNSVFYEAIIDSQLFVFSDLLFAIFSPAKYVKYGNSSKPNKTMGKFWNLLDFKRPHGIIWNFWFIWRYDFFLIGNSCINLTDRSLKEVYSTMVHRFCGFNPQPGFAKDLKNYTWC